jgi:hypothetical protein
LVRVGESVPNNASSFLNCKNPNEKKRMDEH